MQQSVAKQSYLELAEQTSMPLFNRPFWLDAASVSHSWDVVSSSASSSPAVSSIFLPLFSFQKFGFRIVSNPQLTQALSPIVFMPAAQHGRNTDVARTQLESSLVQLLNDFCVQNHSAYCQISGYFSHAFLEEAKVRKFCVSERVTYRIPAGRSREEIVSAFSTNKRRQLHHASGLTLVELSVTDFYAFHASCLKAQGKKINYSAAYADSLLGAALSHNCCRLLGAQNVEGQLLAAVGLVFDEHVCYYLLPTYRPDFSKSGAMAWLTTEAIVWASSSGRIFDFEGSMVPSIARSYREFGGQPTTYHTLEKYYNPILRFLMTFHKIA